MKQIPAATIALVLFSLCISVTGCRKSVPPPTPLTEAELPGAIEAAFVTAKQPEAKDLAAQVVSAFQTKDYSKAFWAIQTLCGVQGLSKEQANVAARATLTISSLLQTAQTQGDAKSEQTLKRYMETK